ncbi:glycine-rich cell wall structural protein-like [Ostrinia furnacalis]|uniref:glycine-rich cell wall structural protein-like n=1 Tax=Ostrinia furnacalis TaxID=93504 RepID=UPI00103F2374|nr:glycine-rich cell wall structural protein-like [Ostrinia furnacalis]
MACKNLAFIIVSLVLLVAALAAPAEKQQPAEAEPAPQKEDLVSASEDLKPAASHWGGGWGGWGGLGGHWGGHYGGYYPYYGSYWGGWPSYGYGGYGGYGGYWPYGGYYGHHGGYWW